MTPTALVAEPGEGCKAGESGAGERGIPVSFGGVTFRPGAMLHADGDGVVGLGS